MFLIRETTTWEIADHCILRRRFIFNMAVAFEALKVCETLEGILKGTFGPNGLDVLLNSSSGDILITNNGALILRSLNLENRIGQTIVDKVASFCGITGDGSTSFILLLTSLLREVINHTRIKANINGVEISSSQGQSLFALSRAFFKLETTLLEVVIPVLNNIAITTPVGVENLSLIKHKINRLITTTLNEKFPINIVTLFTQLLCDLVTKTWNSSAISLKESVLLMVDEFSQICIEVPGIPISSSQIKPGILIPRQFATDLEEISSTPLNFKFVVINCSVDFSGPQTSSSIQIKDQISLDTSLQWKRNQVQKVITMFQQHNIRLILASENVSDLVLHFCRQYDIAVVSMIPQECTEYICKCTGVLPIDNLDSENLSELFKGTGISCGIQRVGQCKAVCLQVDPSNVKFIPHYLLLCSPVQGLCKQYCIALHNALKCVKMSFNADGRNLLFLPGGGAAEFAVSFSLKAFAQTVSDSNLSLAVKILSNALQTIPWTLHQNSFSMSHEKGSFVHCLTEVERSLKNNSVMLGIDYKTGKPMDSAKLEIYEPLSGKYVLLQSLLQCLSQLLRTEKFIGVKTVI